MPGEAEHTAGNVRFKDAMTMAIDYPDLLEASGKASGRAGRLQARHLRCVLLLLKARCSMSQAQVTKVLAALPTTPQANGAEDSRVAQHEVGRVPQLLPPICWGCPLP